jgi:hypothetical protein
VERGRSASADPRSGVAYFEWSAPDDADLADPNVWPQYHPAYGTLIDAAAMIAAREQFGPEGFARAYGNRWPTAEADWRANWPNLPYVLIPETAPVVLAVDAPPSQRSASIGAASRLDDGTIAVEVVDTRPGTDWLTDRVVDLARRHRATVVVQKSGPAGYLIDDLARAGVRVQTATQSDYADACGRFRTLCGESRLAHARDPRLDHAVAMAVTRKSGDRNVWVRGDDIPPLLAVAWAAWHASNPLPSPVVYSLPS